MKQNWRKEIEWLVQILNRITDAPAGDVWYTDADGQRKTRIGVYRIERAYGQPRLQQITSETGAERDVSPRLSNRELALWLDGMIAGIARERKNHRP
jgi:hypothetical protein